MFGVSKEIARFEEGLFTICLFQDTRRLDEDDEYVQFHLDVIHPQGQLVLGEVSVGSLYDLLYRAKCRIAEQQKMFEGSEAVSPADV